MGAVPVLIMLAALGVDYGWQPDGTTSPRGDNVQYIIQIPPHQLDQVRSVGEITSTIDPEIQGRVSRIVVQIGTGPLPRDAGRGLSGADAAAAACVTQAVALADDTAQIPIPEITDDPQETLASNQSDYSEAFGRSANESLMKPDPQSGGYSLPEGLQTPVRTNPEVSTEPATARDDAWGDISGRSSSTGRSPTAAGAAAAASPASTGAFAPSTDPVDPSARSQSGAAPDFSGLLQSRQGQFGLPTSPAGSEAARSSGIQPFASAPGGAGSDPLQTPAAAAVGTSGNRPTDPSDPNWSGYGTTRNFGTLPPGLAAGAGITRPPSDSQYAGAGTGVAGAEAQRQSAAAAQNLVGSTGQTAAASEGYGRDAAGNALDRLGRAVDSQGRLIDPQTRQLVDALGNWIDEYGRPIDRLGRPLPAEPGTTSGPTGNANLQAPLVPSQRPGASDYAHPSGYAPGTATSYGQPQYTQPPQGHHYPASPIAGQGNSAAYPSTPGYGQGNDPTTPPYNVAQGGTTHPTNPANYSPSMPQGNYTSAPGANDGRSDSRPTQSGDLSRSARGYDEDNFRSPSDSRRDWPARAGSDASALDRDLAAPASSTSAARPRTVVAQPFFYFLGLISLVGNAYLIYETAILRRKFRNMIASVRAAKLAPQPANS